MLYELLTGKILQATPLRKDLNKNGAGSLAKKHSQPKVATNKSRHQLYVYLP